MPGWQTWRARWCGRHGQQGLGLPETLVALAVLGIALSGLLAAHWQAWQLQQEALQRRQTVLLLADFLVRHQLNPRARADYRRLLQAPLPPRSHVADACLLAACLPAERARADVSALAMSLSRHLSRPGWQLAHCQDAPGDCLQVAWGLEHSRRADAQPCFTTARPQQRVRCVVLELP